MSSPILFANPFFQAAFDAETGNLAQFTDAGEPDSIIRRVSIRYRAEGRLFAENSDEPDAIPPRVERVRRGRGVVTSLLSTPHLSIKRVFQMTPVSPLMRMRYEFTATTKATLHGPGLLYLQLAPDVNDVASDEKDLYFDGAELGGRTELPCWRVLYRAGYRRGVMVATRSKRQMSHVMYDGQTIEVRPHVYGQQQVNYSARDIPIAMKRGTRHVVELEIGPWRSGLHKGIIRAAELDRPSSVEVDATPGPKGQHKAGQVHWLADWATKGVTTGSFHPRKWLRLGLPWNRRRAVLVCNAGCRPPSFVIKPKVDGPCRVYVGGSRSASMGLHFSGDLYPIYRLGFGGTAFHSVLHGDDQTAELDFGIVNMTGRTVRVVANHNGHWPARLDYVRFEPLESKAAAAWIRRQATPLKIQLMGLPDVGDVFFYLADRNNLDPRLVEGNLWEQTRLGLTRFYWQMHGTYTGFHTNIGTRTPMMCKGHGAFEPQIKCRALFERKYDMLRLVLDAGRKLGVEVWGASRMNSYMSGKRDEFFQKNPHFAEITEDGATCGNKICYAIPQVRDYQRSILVEAAQYGLPGLMLGFLRHPPMFLYHPVLVGGYRQRYGKLPPRDLGTPDPFHSKALPESGKDYLQWYAYRAQFMTQFGRDLKRDLRDKGLGHVKVSLWLRPNHCLFDGINLEDWLSEGLCDEVVADIYSNVSDPAFDEPTPAWRKMVQAKVPLLKGIGAGGHVDYATRRMPGYIADGYDGICIYASEQFGQRTADLVLLDLLRQ